MRADKKTLTTIVIDGYLYYFTSWLPDKLAPKRVFFIPCVFRKVPEDLPEGYRKPTGRKKRYMFISMQFRKLPEAYRKSYRKLVLGVSNILQFRKVPEAGRKNSRKRFCSDSFSR